MVRENNDKVFIMQFDSAVQMRQPLTSVRETGRRPGLCGYRDQQQVRLQNGGGTLLYDAVVQASNDVMKKLTGRKALIVLSDGVDFGSTERLMTPWRPRSAPTR